MSGRKRATVPIFGRRWIAIAVAVSVWPIEALRLLGVV